MTTSDIDLIRSATRELRDAMVKLQEHVEFGTIPMADLQRELEQAAVALDELDRALGVLAGEAPPGITIRADPAMPVDVIRMVDNISGRSVVVRVDDDEDTGTGPVLGVGS